MKKVHTNKGFTLAELLIVVAIIAVMVAIAIPTFGTQAENAREGVDAANIRAKYAEIVSYILASNSTEEIKGTDYKVTMKQQQTDWQNTDIVTNLAELEKTGDKDKGIMKVTITDGAASGTKTGAEALKLMGKGSTATFTYAPATDSDAATLTITVTAGS